jgi:ABC-type polar amino acid transport system ATPase subunit
MRFEIELKNYRCFPDTAPARWTLAEGFTAFVGPNNSGKSSLLRFFHEFKDLWSLLKAPKNPPFWEAAMEAEGMRHYGGVRSVADEDEVFSNTTDRPLVVRFKSSAPVIANRLQVTAVSAIVARRNASVRIEVEVNDQPVKLTGGGEDVVMVATSQGVVEVDYSPYQALFAALEQSVYLGPFRNAVNIGASSNYYDLQIGQAFIEAWDAARLGPSRELNRRTMAVERQIKRIFGFDELNIQAAPRSETLHITVDGQPYQLQEQGAGLTQFILVLAFVALNRPAWIFIDEPELNLHPALQLDFLTTLAGYAEHGIVFATHSLGLARAGAQEIYSVRPRNPSERNIEPLAGAKNLTQLLGEMSYSGHQELGFRLLLLVEGRKDVPVFQVLLRKYGIEHEVVQVPLGGTTLITGHAAAELAELKRIADGIAVVIDGERASAGADLDSDRQAFVEACEALGFETCVLDRRAIENYLSERAVKEVKGAAYRALGPFEERKSVSPMWGKGENWRIAAAMNADELAQTDLGQFLERLRERIRTEASAVPTS